MGFLERGNVAFGLCMNLMDRYFHSSLPLLAHHAECYYYIGTGGAPVVVRRYVWSYMAYLAECMSFVVGGVFRSKGRELLKATHSSS